MSSGGRETDRSTQAVSLDSHSFEYTPSGVAEGTSPPGSGLRFVDDREYEVDEEQGRGGIGVVYRARDVRLDRVVALKELQRLDRTSRARFEQEMRITARLQHPGVIPVHEAGQWPSGEPFYAMKFVEGRPLKDVIAETNSLAERLALIPNVLAVADTVAYAHGQGILHRDLKPSNIILGAFGETIVIDWGLAKDLRERECKDVPGGSFPSLVDASMTRTGCVVGTPAYMSPEQARGDDVDARSDIYSLGALLYHVLAGNPPFANPMTEGGTDIHIQAPPPIETIVPDVPTALAAIVGKAMSPGPDERYPTAKDLVDDLRRFHTGKLVGAHEYSWLELSRRWVRRHRLVLSIAGAALLAIGLIGLLSLSRIMHESARARRQQKLAEEARHESERRASALILLQARSELDRDPAAAVAWLKEYPESAEDWAGARNLLLTARSRAMSRHVMAAGTATVHVVALSPDGTLAVTGGDDRRMRIWDVGTGRLVREQAIERAIYSIAVSRNGRYLVTGGAEQLDVFDWSLQRLFTWRLPGGSIGDLRFSPDESLVAAAGGGTRAVHVVELEAGTRRVLRHPGFVRSVAFLDQKTVLAGDSTGDVRRWDLSRGQGKTIASGLGEIYTFSLSETGHRLIVGDADGHVVVLDPRSGAMQWKQDASGRVRRVTVTSDGRLFAFAGQDGSVRLYDAAGKLLRTFRHDAEVYDLTFTRDESRLISSGLDKTIRIWGLDGLSNWTLRGHRSSVYAVALSPDDRRLVSIGADLTARIWDVPARQSRVVNEHLDDIYRIAFSRDGRFLASVGRDRHVGIAEIATGKRHLLSGHADLIYAIDSLPENRFVSASWDGTVRIWDALAGRSLMELPGGGVRLNRVRASLDGAYVAASDTAGTVYVWDTSSWSRRALHTSESSVFALAFSPDGRQLAAGAQNGAVYRWDSSDWRPSSVLAHEGPVRAVQFIDGERLLSASEDGTVRLWMAGRKASEVFMTLHSVATDVVVSKGGRYVAASAADGTVALWSDRGTVFLRDHDGAVKSIAFSAEGDLLLSASRDGSVRMWNPSDGSLLDVRAEHSSFVTDVDFAPDGRTFASASIDRTLRVWSTWTAERIGRDVPSIRKAMSSLTSLTVSEFVERRRESP